MKRLIVNAQVLSLRGLGLPRTGREMGSLAPYRDGAVLLDGERVAAVGPREEVLKHPDARKGRVHDAGGRVVLPGFVDSHAHPVFAEPRLKDFESRARGRTYLEIAGEGGGILSSVRALRGATQEELAASLAARARAFLECGTTTLEAKSGYGLDTDSELKSLRAVAQAARETPLELCATFLGAHAVPPEYEGRAEDYARLLCSETLPKVREEGLARFVDAFCEERYFPAELARRVLAAGRAAGLGVKVHAEQLERGGGARLAAELGAVSADHLDRAGPEDFALLKASKTVATLLPGCNHFLGLKEYPDARGMIAAGLPVALATDFNPGTCPCWNMQEIVSLAVTRMGMSCEEALCAATFNAAHALGLGASHGSLEPGKQADLAVMDCRDYREIAYWFGANLAVAVFKKGTPVAGSLWE